MILFDAHCDTLDLSADIYDGDAHINLKKAKIFDAYAQFFAMWTPNGEEGKFDTEEEKIAALKSDYDRMKAKYDKMLVDYPTLVMGCKNLTDLCTARKNGKIGAFLSVEGGEMTLAYPLEKMYSDGVRMLTLTWNHKNHLGGTNVTGGGLTADGEAFVKSAQSMGIIIDVSHGSEELFWDVIKIAKKPVVASHSNSRTLCTHKRNLTDEQFKALIRVGGVAGINLYDVFVKDGGGSDINDVCSHIEHFLSLGGENNIAMGFDLDGCDVLPKGISDISDTPKIQNALYERGICESVINKMFWGNLQRVVGECL